MMKFKVGDRVQLRIIPSFEKAGRFMQACEKGVVTAVSDDEYTVTFEDSSTPVAHLIDSEIDPTRE